MRSIFLLGPAGRSFRKLEYAIVDLTHPTYLELTFFYFIFSRQGEWSRWQFFAVISNIFSSHPLITDQLVHLMKYSGPW